MKRNVMKIGVFAKDDYRKRTIAIAKGEYKPSKDEPKVWFESMESVGQVLSGQSQELLRIIEAATRIPSLANGCWMPGRSSV